MASKKKYYAVAVGRTPGIYTRWFGKGGAEEKVRQYRGAVYKGFATIEEARTAFDGLEKLPFQEIIKQVAAYKGRQRGPRRDR